ncbi:hypothetical protein [Bradyrhizobium sp. LHD-71]|nr:hypothetical protein [Bradyrhizobium sp. LHD-71]MDQ8728669.1 hypothetical protein [Bradyrhizobium sp. LHD-71]
MLNFTLVCRFLAIPVAMTSFVLLASQAGGFVLRKNQAPGIEIQMAAPRS